MEEYFTQRLKYGDLPSFYLEMADAIAACGNPKEAVEIALSALELSEGNSDTISIVADRLISYGSFDQAISLFEYVAELAPDRPQPVRNLALALDAAANQSGLTRRERRQYYRDAIEQLNHIITKVWNADYEGIEVITIMEANRIIRRLESIGGWDRAFDDRLQKLLDVDIRVVTSWNADIVDIDLWVDEPTKERAMYSNPSTAIGGRLSNDMTGGYGPEEYLLKKAVLGKYEIRLDYYGSDIINPNGPITSRVHIFRNWGRDDETVDVVDLEFTDDEQSEYLVGEIMIQ